MVLMSVGLVLFNLADLSVEPTINETGRLPLSGFKLLGVLE